MPDRGCRSPCPIDTADGMVVVRSQRRLDCQQPRDGGSTTNAVRKKVCHEIGHTAGMAHYGNGDPYYTSPDPPSPA